MRSTHSLRHRHHHWEAMTDTSHTLPTITQTHLTTVHYMFVVVGRGSNIKATRLKLHCIYYITILMTVQVILSHCVFFILHCRLVRQVSDQPARQEAVAMHYMQITSLWSIQVHLPSQQLFILAANYQSYTTHEDIIFDVHSTQQSANRP